MRLVAIQALLLAACVPAFAADLDIPIHVHAGDGQASECMTSRVAKLDPQGDNYLSVRSGPGQSCRELDRLHTGELVTIFETQGQWVGVVYRTRNPDCYATATKPISFPRRGWISSKFLTDVAG